MKYEYIPGFLLALSGVMIAALSQLMLKKSAEHNYPSKIGEYLNPLVVGGYAIMLCTTFLNAIAMRWIPLSFVVALDTSGQIFVPAFSCLLLKEKINKGKCFSIAVIVVGIIIFLL